MISGVSFLAGPDRPRTRMGEAAGFAEGLWDIGRGCYAWMVPNGSWGETNLGLIRGARETLLVDTGWDPVIMREVLDYAAPVLEGAPIGTVVNTHADGDHCWGNQLFAGRPIVATDATIRGFRQHTPLECLALKCACGALRHLRLGGADRFGRYMGGMFGPYRMGAVRLTRPTIGFSGRTTLRLGDETVALIEVGPGHAAGDCMVHLPERRVVFAGDVLFVGLTPVAWAGPIANIVAALRLLLTLAADIVVPGHGRLATRADIEDQLAYWDFAEERLSRAFERGCPPHMAAREILRGAAFAGSAFRDWDSPERLVTSAYTYYRTRAGTRPRGALGILRRQAEVAFALPEATPARMHTK